MTYPAIYFTLLDNQFFESLDLYRPSCELSDIVKQQCEPGWLVDPRGFWTYCQPPHYKPIDQGWKIHVSGTPLTAGDLLEKLTPIFIENRLAFKFCSDLRMLRLSTGKNWARTGAGKFITAYPRGSATFLKVIEQCHEATRDLSGPYLLTDRPYPNSRVMFYRYGGHLMLLRPGPGGRRIPTIIGPDGADFSDERRPYFSLPPWVSDPLGGSHPGGKREISTASLKQGRFEIISCLRYSAFGGIYRAIDKTTNEEVIIREHRPLLGDWQSRLQKGARILQRLSPTGVVPRYVDHFSEGGHSFLVEERLFADSLWSRTGEMLFGHAAARSPEAVFHDLRETIVRVIHALQVVHSKDIVLRDLTKTNVLFTRDKLEVKLIDFELAYEIDREDSFVPGGTPGYVSPQQLQNQTPTYEEDYYALGSLIVDAVRVTAAGLSLNRAGVFESLKQGLADLGLPLVFADIAERLSHPQPAERLTLAEALRMLNAAKVPQHRQLLDTLVLPQYEQCPPREPPSQDLIQTIEKTQIGIADYILSKTTYERHDRLWPASSLVFHTSPVCVRFGAAGIASYLLRVHGTVSGQIIEWILRHSLVEPVSPALYYGLSGVALFFWIVV